MMAHGHTRPSARCACAVPCDALMRPICTAQRRLIFGPATAVRCVLPKCPHPALRSRGPTRFCACAGKTVVAERSGCEPRRTAATAGEAIRGTEKEIARRPDTAATTAPLFLPCAGRCRCAPRLRCAALRCSLRCWRCALPSMHLICPPMRPSSGTGRRST